MYLYNGRFPFVVSEAVAFLTLFLGSTAGALPFLALSASQRLFERGGGLPDLFRFCDDEEEEEEEEDEDE